MRAAKLRPVTNGRGLAANYNEQVRGEKVAEHNDVYGIEWTDEDEGGSNDVLLGERALRLPCFSPPPGSKLSKRSERPWQLYRPFRRGGLDLARYKEHYGASAALQALLGDIRAIWEYAISHDPADSEERREAGQVAEVGLGIPQREWASHSVILIVPDLFSREHIRALVQLLLGDMGFGAACVQTEGVCATFGAGISGACVVDFGAEHVGVCCVDEGLVLPDSRLELSYGGADISSFFFALLQRANFPYADADLNARIADAMLIDSLKERLCTLNPTDFGLNMYDFHVRLPGKPTTKYMLRTYDEVIIAPMCLFNPRVIDFDVKRPYLNQVVWVDEAEDPGEPVTATSFGMLPITLAMQNCTRHLLPPEPPAPVAAAPPPASTEESTPLPTPAGEVANPLLAKAADENGRATPSGISSAGTPPIPSSEAPGPGPTLPTASTTDGAVQPSSAPAAPTPSAPQVDVAFEASKVPLDVAVWNSLLAAGGGSGGGGGGGGNAEERIKRLASNIVFTGGTAQMPGLAQALEAR